MRTRPERHNAVKLLMLLDIGGSMDDHMRVCEELFSAARAEFSHLVHFYFHNCLYESVWKDNRRRHVERIGTDALLNTYGRDYKVIVVGDASMSAYELLQSGGSVEHWNAEPGKVWLERLLRQWPDAVWLNPVRREHWGFTQSIGIVGSLFCDRMFPLTLAGLDEAVRTLARRTH